MSEFLGRLSWRDGRILDGDIRYLMLRADVLMDVFRRLTPSAREEAFEAFARSVRDGGRRSAERYRKLGAGDAERLLATIESTAPQLGWGLWSFAVDDGGWDLGVVDSPFAAAYGCAEAPVCAPIRGMLLALADLLLGGRAEVREVACVAVGAETCRFRVVQS